MLYLSIRTWKEIPVLWPAHGLFSGHESCNGTKLVPLSIKWPSGQVMVVYPLGHIMFYQETVLA